MVGYLLETSALSAYLNQRHRHYARTKQTIDSLPSDAIKLVSIVTLAEIDYGIQLAEISGSSKLDEYRECLRVVRQYASLDITHHTAEVYAELKTGIAAQMRRRTDGKMPRWIEDWIGVGTGKNLQIDENDLWICAQGKERDLTIITADVGYHSVASIDNDVRILLTCV